MTDNWTPNNRGFQARRKPKPKSEETKVMMVDCPCCHGLRSMLVYDEEDKTQPPQKFTCTHCEGKGEVYAEDEE